MVASLRRGHRSSHPHPNTTCWKELNIIIRLDRPRGRRSPPLGRDLGRKPRVITPQFERSFSLLFGGMLYSGQRAHSRIALLCSTLMCAVVTRRIRKRAPILRRVAVGRHALVPCLEEGFEAGQTLGDQRPVHDHLGQDIGLDDVSDGVVVS